MAKRLIDANALCEFFRERFEYLRNASEKQLPNGRVEIDLEIQCGAVIAKEFLDKAKAAPTVDAVEVVHGWWIDTEDGETRCSNCEIRIPEMYSNADTVIKSECRFCHYCGAKMDGGNEDV